MSTIWLDKDKNKIVLKSDWHPDLPEMCKSIGGGRWDPKRKAWVYDLHWLVCLKIRKQIATPLGWRIRLSVEMKEWAEAEKLRQDAIPDAQSNELKKLALSEYAPQIWSAVSRRPFQTVGIDFGVRTRRFILADDPGLGKTLQTIGMMEESQIQGPILVVANKSAQQITWPNEIRKWTNDRVVVFDATIPKAERDQKIYDLFDSFYDDEENFVGGERVWVVMNPYWVRMKAEVDDYGKYIRNDDGVKIVKAEVPAIFMDTWSAVIADESHETLATDTGNAKKWSQQRQGLGALRVASDGFKISISGTPMRGKPVNMFGQLNWLYPEQYTGFWNWAKRHFKVTNDGHRGAMEVGSLLNEKEFYKELAPVMIRRDKAMVASDLPPKQYGGSHFDPKDDNTVIGVWLPMEKEQKKAYEEFVKKQVFTDLEGNELDAIGVLAQYTRMKQLATSFGSVGEKMVPIPILDPSGNKIKTEDGTCTLDSEGWPINRLEDGSGKICYEIDPKTGQKLLQPKAIFIPGLPSNKYEWLKEWLMERDLIGKYAKATGKVIIASQFRQVIDMVRKDLEENHGTKSFAITGETSTKNRVRQQDEFQNNPNSPKIFFLQSKAGGTSLTLDQADDVIILDEMWDPDVQLQIEDRAHRLSNTEHHVTVWYVRSLDTIEEHIGTTVDERMRTCRGILDGSRGVDIRKRLAGAAWQISTPRQ